MNARGESSRPSDTSSRFGCGSDRMPSSRWTRLRSAILALALPLASLPPAAHAQFSVPVGTNLFGDELVQKPDPTTARAGFAFTANLGSTANQQREQTPGYLNTLIFQDRRQLRGDFSAISKEGIIWRVPDASEPLRIPMAGSAKIVLIDPVNPGSATFIQRAVPKPTDSTSHDAQPIPATLKLAGTDWLFGEVASADGEEFSVTLKDDVKFTIPRASIEWIFFDKNPAPALGFTGSVLELAGWTTSTPLWKLPGKDNSLTFSGSLGRQFNAPPSAFEMSFELPKGLEENLSVVFSITAERQTVLPGGGKQTRFFGGQASLAFSKKELKHQVNLRNANQKTIPTPEATAPAGAPVRIRIFCDSAAGRLAVYKDGHQLDDWKFIEDDKKDGETDDESLEVRGFYLVAGDAGTSSVVVQNLKIAPWDRVSPTNDEPEVVQDRLTVPGEAPLDGKLNAIADGLIAIDGTAKSIAAGTFVRLNTHPKPLADTVCLLPIGSHGALCASKVEMDGTQLRCCTSASPELLIPLSLVDTITLPPAPPPSAEPAALLVFKDGDELRGSLLAAAPGSPLRWKTAEGQSVDFQTSRLAGVLFNPERADPANKLVLVETTTGDRLVGEIVAFDGETLQLKNGSLGVVSLKKSALLDLYPNGTLPNWDGASAPDAWMKTPEPQYLVSEIVRNGSQWLYLDGCYVSRTAWPGRFNQRIAEGALGPIDATSRIEISCDITLQAQKLPSFRLYSPPGDGRTSLIYDFTAGDFFASAGSLAPQRQNLADKLKDSTSRINFRAFLDPSAGAVTFYINGIEAGKIRQTNRSEKQHWNGGPLRFSLRRSGNEIETISNVRITPWTGELPSNDSKLEGGAVIFTSGDSVQAKLQRLQAGHLTLETDLGPLSPAVDHVVRVQFSNAVPEQPAGPRIHLADGSYLQVSDYSADDNSITAHSPFFGELKIPLGALSELVLHGQAKPSPSPLETRKK